MITTLCLVGSAPCSKTIFRRGEGAAIEPCRCCIECPVACDPFGVPFNDARDAILAKLGALTITDPAKGATETSQQAAMHLLFNANRAI